MYRKNKIRLGAIDVSWLGGALEFKKYEDPLANKEINYVLKSKTASDLKTFDEKINKSIVENFFNLVNKSESTNTTVTNINNIRIESDQKINLKIDIDQTNTINVTQNSFIDNFNKSVSKTIDQVALNLNQTLQSTLSLENEQNSTQDKKESLLNQVLNFISRPGESTNNYIQVDNTNEILNSQTMKSIHENYFKNSNHTRISNKIVSKLFNSAIVSKIFLIGKKDVNLSIKINVLQSTITSVISQYSTFLDILTSFENNKSFKIDEALKSDLKALATQKELLIKKDETISDVFDSTIGVLPKLFSSVAVIALVGGLVFLFVFFKYFKR